MRAGTSPKIGSTLSHFGRDRRLLVRGSCRAVPGTAKVFHAGTALKGGAVVTGGGRVLCVVGLGENVAAAREHAYAGVAAIRWDGKHHRHDIGYRAIERGA